MKGELNCSDLGPSKKNISVESSSVNEKIAKVEYEFGHSDERRDVYLCHRLLTPPSL